MLTELKRCNSIGNKQGIVFLIKMFTDRRHISLKEIQNRCALEYGITVHCSGAIAFLEYLGFVTVENDNVVQVDSFKMLVGISDMQIIDCLVRICILRLTQDGIFDNDSFFFNVDDGKINIKRSAFPLDYAAIRNFMIMSTAFSEDENNIMISPQYEIEFISKISNRRKKITLEQLIKDQEEQSKRGLLAEKFVLELEKKRLPGKASQIKRISDFDVAAGYDIVSYEDEGSTTYDRFIEVKSYLGSEHFYWSENESDVAKMKGEKYVLCLVDFERISEEEYKPQFIVNPHKAIFEENQWMVSTASFKIKKI